MAEEGIIKTVKPLLSGITYVLVKYTVVKLTPNNAPINVNPVGGGGGVRARGGDLTNFKIF